MARATVQLPAMLAEACGAARFDVEGKTLREALDALYRAAPALRFHLCEESGRFRGHVLCLLNDERAADLDAPLRDDDRIAFVQAISGG
jgi:molybdopterin converting factor small subunit